MPFYESVVFEIDAVILNTLPAMRSLCIPADNKMSDKARENALRACLMRQSTESPWEKGFAESLGLTFNPNAAPTDAILAGCLPYAGIDALLKSLKNKGVTVGAISMLPAQIAATLLHNTELTYFLDAVVCDDIDMPRAKDALLRDCYEVLDASPDRSAVIGAFPSTALAAWQGMSTFFASAYGFGFEDRTDAGSFSPSFIAENPQDFMRLDKHSVLLS